MTKQGVKLLDFGLAKVKTGCASGDDDATRDGAHRARARFSGRCCTCRRSRPRQEPIARSDIFSFGLVLYEMLTGKRAFDGTTPASVIAAIVEREAPSVADVAPRAPIACLSVAWRKTRLIAGGARMIWARRWSA